MLDDKRNTKKTRARDLGIPLEGTPGPNNAITDVGGVEVGFTTLINGNGKLAVGKGPVRTGVTALLPRGAGYDPVFAGWYALNGNGEMTGTTWIEESGFLEGPVLITNTHSVGVVRDAVIRWQIENHLYDPISFELSSDDTNPDIFNASSSPDIFWALPVVGETYDGGLNDINGLHVREEHVFSALRNAESGPVTEGNTGGGTGMICHGFKGGTGTASRILEIRETRYTLGVLVQANHGARESFTVAGIPVGREFQNMPPSIKYPSGAGSIIVIVATDAPLLPHQLKRIARRVPFGIGKVGGVGDNTSGDIFLAFSTANRGAWGRSDLRTVKFLPNDLITPLFRATAEVTEEAILNALLTAETMEGINGNTVYSLPHEQLKSILKQFGRLVEY